MEAPATPTMDFGVMDDSATFELFDGSITVQNRKRRRSSLRRVSFAEQPSIHVFARDDDYETPPEGTMSHLSTQSTPSSVSRSPQRRSERLSTARGRRQDANEADKENAKTSAGSNARQKRVGRRPLGLRDTQKEAQENFMKPINWLNDHENSALGRCDENTGPVDLHHITMCDKVVVVEDDDNMTMDSQTFHTRVSQMLANQTLHRLSEGHETATRTPRDYTDMVADVSVLWPEKKVQEVERKLLDQPTWHKGDGDISDMIQGSVEALLRVLARKKSSREDLIVHDTEENTLEDWDNWTEGDAQSQGKILSMQNGRPVSQPDETASMETRAPVLSGDGRKLFVDEGEQITVSRNMCGADGLCGSQLQGCTTSKDTECHVRRPVAILENRASVFGNDDNDSEQNNSQFLAGERDAAMEIHSGTVERLCNLHMQSSTTPEKLKATEPERTVLVSRVQEAAEPNVNLVGDDRGSDPAVQSAAGAAEDSPVLLRRYERSRKRVSTSAAEMNTSGSTHPQKGSNIQFSISQGHAPYVTAESVAEVHIDECGQGLGRRGPILPMRILNKDIRQSIGLPDFDGADHLGTKSGASLPAPDVDTDSMDITRTWTEHAPQPTSVRATLFDSAKSSFWEDTDQRMDVFDEDMMGRYQEGITEAMPKLTSVLGGYNCDSPSVEPLNRIFRRKGDIDAGDYAVYRVTAETDVLKEKTFEKGDDISPNRPDEEKECASNRSLEEDTSGVQSDSGKIRNVFQSPEDTFNSKGNQRSLRETSVSMSMGQNLTFTPSFPKVQGKGDAIEANPSAQPSLAQDVQDDDAAAVFTDQHNWRAEVSSDMSTTPLSPRRSKRFQPLVLKDQTVPMQIDTALTDSLSFRYDISASIPNVQDLAADARSPESGLSWNPREIVWSAQQSDLRALRGEVVSRQPAIGHMEAEAIHSMADKLCTPRGSKESKHIFECMSEDAVVTLHQVSHSREVQNSLASRMVLRMMYLQHNDCAQEESSSDVETGQILRRTLHFQSESDSRLQSWPLRGDAEQQNSARNPDGTMEVKSLEIVNEVMNFNESRVASLQQESRWQRLRPEMQVVDERLTALERRSEELRIRSKDFHQVIAKKCRNEICFEMKKMTALGSQVHFSKLKKIFQLLNCVQLWDLKITKTGDEVLHEFQYWTLFTHSVLERTDNNLEYNVFKSSIDLHEASINQVYRHMNASLAWRWFLLAHEEIVRPRSLMHHVEGVHAKAMILLDLMEEVNNCRAYVVTPHFQLQTGSALCLNLQFSDSVLLFYFVLSFDMEQLIHMRSSASHELDYSMGVNQKLDCTVRIESPGRIFGIKISETDIKRSLASVVPGRDVLLRVCASVNTLILSCKE